MVTSSVEFWRGTVNGTEVVAVATNIVLKSKNIKTDDMIQTTIMTVDQSPLEAAKAGLDEAVCGNCPLRPIIAEANDTVPCYVDLGRSVGSIWRAFKRGSYPVVTPAELGQMVKASGKLLRQGSYGDPTVVPLEVWEAVDTTKGTSYSHQWRDRPEFAQFAMASVSGVDEAAEAQALGFRTYRVDVDGVGPVAGEIACPNTANKSIKCADCGLCSGNRSGAKNIVIDPIGKFVR